jgi:beta-barrel assembly-enhancing protease
VSLRTALAAAFLTLGTAAYAQGLPDLGDASSASLSDTQERTIGNRIMREVKVDPAYVDDPEINDYMNTLGQRLLLAAEGPRRDIDFFAVQDDTINAFALVGGHIGVHTGLVSLTQNESELAGVIAHEIAHILQRHQARMLHGQRTAQWTSLAALALAMIAGRSGGNQSSQVTEAAIASAGALQIQSQLDYTREHEREADRVGVAILERAGYDPHAMVSFFERMLRANRLSEFKGAPSYLRTHPLTTERIADMQDRVQKVAGMSFSMRAADSFEYRLVRAKIRAAAGSSSEAVELFRVALQDKTVVRPREDVYGLALALRRTRDLDGAWKTLQPLREGAGSHPAFELLAAQLAADMGRAEESLRIYREALRANGGYRGLLYGYLGQLLQMGRDREALAELQERLRLAQDDARLYEIQARAFEHTGQRVQQHRAQAEAYYRKGNLSAAVDQLEIALKVKGSDFYEMSSAESRLRELRAQLEIQRAAEKALNIS